MRTGTFRPALYIAAMLVLLAAMPVWRWAGNGLPMPEGYAISPEDFQVRLDEQEKAYAVGEDGAGTPIVAPPPGDVYLGARTFDFSPKLRLTAGATYRLHVSSLDVLHGFYFPLGGADVLLMPGHALVIDLAPLQAGEFAMQCSENCGLGHNKMRGVVDVVAP